MNALRIASKSWAARTMGLVAGAALLLSGCATKTGTGAAAGAGGGALLGAGIGALAGGRNGALLGAGLGARRHGSWRARFALRTQ